MNTQPFPVWGRRYQTLPKACYHEWSPTPVPDPFWVALNETLARELGLPDDWPTRYLPLFAGCELPDAVTPLAALYAGHQFGVYVPQLGDGRAILLGDVPWQQGRVEIQLKGAGKTPFSRMGDGRAVLRSSIREYLGSEAMHGLGIPTTRALCLAGSGLTVWREEPEPAAVLTRLAPSFIRFGTFEALSHQGLHDELRALADFAIQHHFPHLLTVDEPYAALFAEICQLTAELIAQWQAVGFCHGVMNTDNMSILGLTLDYGPFGFLDHFDVEHICNHSDHAGRYAYQQQPRVALWNLQCLAGAFLPLVREAALMDALSGFATGYEQAWLSRLRAKLGLQQPQAEDRELIEDLLALLHAQAVDFSRFFRALSHWRPGAAAHGLSALCTEPDALMLWLNGYQARLLLEGSVDQARLPAMLAVNPKYVLRNYLAEQAIRQATVEQDFSEIERLARCLAHPFDEAPEFEAYAALPPDWAYSLCLSCSS